MLSQDAKQFAVKAKDLYHQAGPPGQRGWGEGGLIARLLRRRGDRCRGRSCGWVPCMLP